jgi:hypothetical protein
MLIIMFVWSLVPLPLAILSIHWFGLVNSLTGRELYGVCAVVFIVWVSGFLFLGFTWDKRAGSSQSPKTVEP